ncbi:thioesterase family protein [Comamonas sp. Y33R10-2]|uniref:acyl-CoA thioesterase n=1 Tax=Comamonas sp. Y33R10-2 TaxID=2853257 RepID=UPI001C5CABFD|nr:thioesterase family protein [Comamonas sp. Y33R10-2]QXZ09325.1 thioesterase family protein [Comamonas sp. Y33R10-2]
MSTDLHPFDRAVTLTVTGVPNQYQGQASSDYWNMVGPYGGITAASLLQAVQQHPQCLGDPLSITVNYSAAVGAGALVIDANPVRTNRSTQHWILTVQQPDADGQMQVVTTATAVTAVRRDTWSASDVPMPAVKPAADLERVPPLFKGSEWLSRYEMRFADGILPMDEDAAERDSLTRLWVRDNPPRPLDFASLAAVSDIFFPRAWLRRAKRVPAGTVSMTVYFHAGREDLAAAGDDFLLAQARGQEFRNGFFDQTAQLWSQSGQILATSHQIVYFKE